MRARLAPAPAAPPPARRAGWRGFAGSFRHAWNGVVETAVRQRNMRFHLVAGVLVGALGGALALGAAERLALLLCVFLVLSAEVANSALEALVDLVTLEHHELARLAKDAGAGAVLVLAAGAVAVLAGVLAHAWPAVVAGGAALRAHAALGAALAGVTGALLWPRTRPAALDALLAGAGAALLLGLAWRTESAAFTAVSALLFVVAVAASARRRAAPVA